MTTDPSSDVLERVEQSDREAAAALVEWQNGTGWEPQFFHPGLAAGMREGAWDEHDVVQAFAAHRRATIERLSAERMQLREALGEARAHILASTETFGSGPDDDALLAKIDTALSAENG